MENRKRKLAKIAKKISHRKSRLNSSKKKLSKNSRDF